MPFVVPGNFSRGELDRAGDRFRLDNQTLSDTLILENWRASHLYVINTFQSALRSRKKRQNSDLTIAQRLKRRPTIIDKLSREPGMSLSRMHDIAGCRLIFKTVDELQNFRQGVLESRARHPLVSDQEKYNYIGNPKSSGYRGIHDVYRYRVLSGPGQRWNGLRVEIQYRTFIQHAWATAIEISDIVNSTRLKFSEANRDITRLFLIASEILARSHESRIGPCPDVVTKDLIAEYEALEGKMHAIARLRELTSSTFTRFARSNRLFILVNYVEGEKTGQTDAQGFSETKAAVERYNLLEKQLQGVADVVLVGASEQDSIRLAYTNYFSDASFFLSAIDGGVSLLKEELKAGE